MQHTFQFGADVYDIIVLGAGPRVDDLARVAVSFPTYAEVFVHAAVLAADQLGSPLSGQAERVRGGSNAYREIA